MTEQGKIELRVKAHAALIDNLCLEFPALSRDDASKIAMQIIKGRTLTEIEELLRRNS